MFGLGKTLTFIIKVFLGWFKSILWLVFSLSCFGRKIFDEKGGKIPYSNVQLDASSLRKRSVCLGEGRFA